MKKFFKNLAVFGLLLYGIFYLLDISFTHIFRQGDYLKTQWLYNIRGQHYDFAVHGSSRVYTSIDVARLNRDLGLKGINMALDGSVITTQALMLEMFLANDNEIDRLYLQVDSWNVIEETVSKFSYPRFFPFIKDEIVFEHFKQFGPKWYAYRYIPFLRYSEFNFDWGLHILMNAVFDIFQPDYDQYGSFFYPHNDYRPKNKVIDPKFDLSAEMKYFRKIIDLCKNNNIELTVFTAPYADIDTDQNYYANSKAFKALLEAEGIAYYNFGDILNKKYEYFTDETHLNRQGVDIFTKEIRRLIQGNI